ncbi:rhomboid-related protein 2-like [Physella acuta]|uniref:rhomboid-related protein 2-like n=1 Tax=Physella acuta TaxID=109671 RepID=UPI0027DDD2E9|nr:rhomboid-related protein 2-like [Physella acuta]
MSNTKFNREAEVYTKKIDSQNDDEMKALKKELDEVFKPLFIKNDNNLSLVKLKEELKESGLLANIREERIDKLLNDADRNKDQKLSYFEFSKMFMYQLTKKERESFRRVMKSALATIIPVNKREDFIANYTCCPPPIFIPLISIVEIAVFVYYVLDMKKRGFETTATSGVPMYSPLIYLANRRYEAWRFLSYMLIHNGYLHITSNVVIQMLFGLPLEMIHKWWRVAILYFLGGITGCLANSVADLRVNLAGASGGVYALIGAHIAAIIINWSEMNYHAMDITNSKKKVCISILRLVLCAPFRLAAIFVIVVPDTGLALYRRFSAPASNRTGVIAHIGGLQTGLLLGILVLKNLNTSTWERYLGWLFLLAFLCFFVFCCLVNGFIKEYPVTDWSPLQYF